MNNEWFIALIFLAFVNAQDYVVEIPQGLLRGAIDTTRDGKDFYQFTNIPYAKPPVGELRFKAPVADGGWEGIRENNYTRPKCVQNSSDGDLGSEDCLYLSVYTPELPSANYTSKPVMVFIHGGRFIKNFPRQGGKYLLSEDIILVVIAYRVGIFGFFNVDDPDLGVPGNAAMKDQVLALQWVQNNIAYFGGDPDNVLLFGQSAGGASVHLQVLSPMATGLFHKAIAQSGVALIDIVGGVRNNGILLAEELEIQTNNISDMLNTLQKISALDILAASNSLSAVYDRFNGPLVESQLNELPFLTEEPINLIKSGAYNHVPFIIGYNDAEGLMFQIEHKANTGSDLLISDFTKFIPPDLQIAKNSVEEAELSERIRNFYYGDSEPSSEDITQAIRLYTDYTFGYPAYRSAVEHIETATYPIYFYFFTADTELNLRKKEEETSAEFPGASHGDDLFYLFDMYGFDIPEIIENSVEDLAINSMVTMWTNFAKYDIPMTPNNEIIWAPITEGSFNYLHIDTNESSLKSNLLPDVMEFWQQIYRDFFVAKK